MAHKEFITRRATQVEGPTFSVNGQKFRCIASPPHGFIADLIESRQGNFYPAAVMRNFIRGALVAEDEPAWNELQYAKDGDAAVVDLDLLGDIFRHLTEEFFQRPTQPPSGSPDGRNSTEDTSTADSPSPDKTSTPSTTSDSSTSPTPSQPKASARATSAKPTSKSKNTD